MVTAGAPAGVFLAFASAAHAAGKEITRTGTYTTSRGGSGTMSSVTTRSNGVVSTQGTWTNASGATGTSQSQATWNKSTQTAAVSGSVTKPNGSASSWQGTDVRTAPGTITGSGTQATYSMTDTKVAPGTWDKSEVVTNANGTTVDHNVTTTVSGTSGTRAATTTLPNGRTETRTTTFTQTVTPLPAPGN